MTSKTTRQFRDGLAALPADIQRQADAAYKLFRQDPQLPGLQFKKVHAVEPIYSARITIHYCAVGVVTGDVIVWFWVGKHDAYEALLRSL